MAFIIPGGIIFQVCCAFTWVYSANELNNSFLKAIIPIIYLSGFTYTLYRLPNLKRQASFVASLCFLGSPLTIFLLSEYYPGIFHEDAIPKSFYPFILFLLGKSLFFIISHSILSIAIIGLKKALSKSLPNNL